MKEDIDDPFDLPKCILSDLPKHIFKPHCKKLNYQNAQDKCPLDLTVKCKL